MATVLIPGKYLVNKFPATKDKTKSQIQLFLDESFGDYIRVKADFRKLNTFRVSRFF